MDEDQLIEPVSVEVARHVIQKGLAGLTVNMIEYLGGASFSVLP